MNKPFTLRILIVALVISVFSSQLDAQVFQKNYSLTGTLPIAYNFTESVQQTTDGGFILQGWNMSLVPRMELIKTNNLGVVTWKQSYGNCLLWAMGTCIGGDDPTATSMGGCVQQTADGGYIMTGSFNNSMVLVKTNSTGAVTWGKTFGTSAYGKYVRQTSDGGYVCVGYEGNNVYIVKTGSNGALQWDRSYLLGNYMDEATDVDQINNGQIVVTGYTGQIINPGATADTTTDVFVLRFDQAGGLLSANTYGLDDHSEEGQSITKTSDGGFIVSGYTDQTSFVSASDIFLWKFDASGTLVFQYNYKLGGIFSLDIDFGYAAQETSDGGYALFGVITSYGLTSISYFNNFMVKLDNNADIVFGKAYKDSVSGGAPFSLGYTIWNDGKQMANGGYIIGGSGIPMSAGTGLAYKIIKTNSVGESGCSETNVYPSKYSQPFAEEAITPTDVATSTTADVSVYASLPSVAEETVCSVSCTAFPGHDTSICLGGSVQLGGGGPNGETAMFGMPGYTYSWSSNPPGFTSTDEQPIVSPTENTTYTLEITDSDVPTPCTNSASVAVLILPDPLMHGISSVPPTICEGTSSTLTANVDYATTYTWSPATGLSSTSGASVTATPNATTTYTVVASNSCQSVSSSILLTVVPAPVVNVPSNATICKGDNYPITGTISNYASVLWSSSGTGGTFSPNANISNPTFTPGPNDTLVVLTVAVTANGSCSDTAGHINLVIKPIPPPPAFVIINDTYCANAPSLTLSGGTPTGGTYTGTGVSNGVFSPITAGAGSHIITYTIKNTWGCKNSKTDTIFIIPLPTVTLGTFNNICVTDNSITLSGGLPAGGTYSGTGVTGTSFNPSTAGVGNDNIYYAYKNNAGCSDTASSTITVVPTVTLTSDAPNNAIYVDLGQVVNFTATPTNAGTYAFAIDAVTEQTSTLNTYATNTLQAGQIVYVTLNSACRDSIALIVKPVPNAFVPFTVDGSNDLFMPHVDLTILNRWGQEIYKGTDGWNGQYKGQNVSPGTYFYIIKIIGLDSVEKQFTGTVTLVTK